MQQSSAKLLMIANTRLTLYVYVCVLSAGRCTERGWETTQGVKTAIPHQGLYTLHAHYPYTALLTLPFYSEHVPFTAFAKTWKLFCSRFSSVYGTLEGLWLYVPYKSTTDIDIVQDSLHLPAVPVH